MGRTKAVSDEDIVRIARAVFMKQGVLATTREIAALAGVANGTLHQRFGSKHALFLRAIASHPPPWAAHLMTTVGRGELRSNLEGLAVVMLGWYARVAPLVILAWSVPASVPEIDLAELRGEHALAQYLEREIQLGRARWYDAEHAASMFAAVVWDAALQGLREDDLILRLSPVWGGLGPRENDDAPPSSGRGRVPWPPPAGDDGAAFGEEMGAA
jgi:AcrR family transcriptional regulator